MSLGIKSLYFMVFSVESSRHLRLCNQHSLAVNVCSCVAYLAASMIYSTAVLYRRVSLPAIKCGGLQIMVSTTIIRSTAAIHVCCAERIRRMAPASCRMSLLAKAS